MFRKIHLFTCVLVLFMIVGGGCVVLSPQYHIDMYCGRTEIKSMPLARYWFCTWGTWDNFNENLVAVPFAVPLFLPVGISLDIVTDMALCPLDLFLSFALEEENTFSLIEENDAFYISLPERKPSIAYSSSFGEDCRLLLLKIHKGGISIKGDVSVYGSGEKEGVLYFAVGVGKSCKVFGNRKALAWMPGLFCWGVARGLQCGCRGYAMRVIFWRSIVAESEVS